MPWSYNADDGYGTWDECKAQLKAFHDAHAELVDYKPVAVLRDAPHAVGRNPGKATDVTTVTTYDLRGRVCRTRQGRTVTSSGGGLVICQYRSPAGRVMSVRTMVVGNGF